MMPMLSDQEIMDMIMEEKILPIDYRGFRISLR